MKKQLVALVTAAMISLPSVAGAAAMSAGTTAIVMSSVAAGGSYSQREKEKEKEKEKRESSDMLLNQQTQYPEKVSEVIDWKKRGWLFCPRRDSEPKGCKDDMGVVVPWVEWMKDYAGPDARMLSLIVTSETSVIVSYGVL